jgi:hypothetical protein
MKTRTLAPPLLALALLAACFDFSGQEGTVQFDFEGRGGATAPQCTQDANCPVRQICIRNVCAVGCRADTDCPSGEVCGDPSSPRCTSTLECRVDADCALPTPRCHPSLAVCVACLNSADCAADNVCLIEPACDRGDRACLRDDFACGRCDSDNQCATGACDLATGRCVECGADGDCPSPLVCDPDLRICTACYDNTHCQEPRPACLRGPDGGACVLCALDSDCGPGGTCNRDTRSCEGCRSDADCLGESMRCNPASGLCFDRACAVRQPPALLELVVERRIAAPFLTGAPVVGPLQGLPGPGRPAALAWGSSPPAPEAPSLEVYGDGGARRLWGAASSFGAARGLALGDLEGDGRAEIIALRDGRLTALDPSGNPLWVSGSRTAHLPGLFDVDRDGFAEVVAGNSLFSEVGQRIWVGSGHQGGHTQLGLPGLAVAAQLDGEGPLEIVAGGSVYSAQGELRCQEGADGYSTLTDLDGDGAPEILVISADGAARALTRACELLWGPVSPRGEGQGGGPAAVADMDGDGVAELFYVAREDLLVAVSGAGLLLWEAPLVGAHPAAATSLMDVDGDGLLEVLVSDGEALKLFRAEDGFLLTAHPEGASRLALSGPVLADVDDDGAVEVVVAAGREEAADAVVVFGDVRGRWVDTRNLWNQAAYLPDAVSDELRAPVALGPWWLSRGSQRAQPVTATAAPAGNLALRRIAGAIDASSCPDRFTVGVGLYNRGAAPLSAGTPVVVLGAERGELLLETQAARALMPGEQEVLLLTLDDLPGPRSVVVRLARDAQSELDEPECDTSDNELLLDGIGCPSP